MNHMLKLRKGCTVPLNEKLFEGYERKENYIYANVDSDKIIDVLKDFIAIHDEPLFFILELPGKLEENIVHQKVVESFHKDVYYIDGCTQENALIILREVGELLVNDGMSSFGFGAHYSHNEIMVGKYNLVYIYEVEQGKFNNFFEKYNINEVEQLLTAWDTFSKEYPGETERITTDGKDIYDIPEMFKARGMYLAERREE